MIRSLLGNSVSNVMLHVLRILTTFVMSPIIVRALGNYDYGIWEILAAVIGYMGLLDMGLKPAITRYVARYNALKDTESLHKVYSTSLIFMGIVGIVAFVSLMSWAAIGPGILSEKGTDPMRYALLLLIIGAQALITFPGYLMECIHEGFQRYTLINTVTMITTLIGVAALFFLLQRGYGLLTLALGNAIGTSIKFAVYWILLRLPRYGNFRFRATNLSPSSLKELLGFGSKTFIQSIATTVSNSSDMIVIGAFLGPVAVTFYAIPAKLVLQGRNLIWTITQVFMPFFSDLDARGDKAMIGRVLTVASRYVVGIVLPFLVAVCFLGIPFLARWMGPAYAENGRWVLYILAAAYGLTLMNPFHSRFLTGIGRQGILAVTRSIVAVLTISLSLILVHPLGKEGMALAILIPLIIFEPVILFYTCQHAGITPWKYIYEVIVPLILPTTLFISFLWIVSSMVTLDTYPRILGSGFLGSMIYIVVFFFLAVQGDEKRIILNGMRAGWAPGSVEVRVNRT